MRNVTHLPENGNGKEEGKETYTKYFLIHQDFYRQNGSQKSFRKVGIRQKNCDL